MSFIKSLNNFMYSAIETWFVVTLTPGVILTCGALAVAGLFIPDSWMNERAAARMQKYLTKGKCLPDSKSLDSSPPEDGQLVEDGGQQSDVPNSEGDGNLEISAEKLASAEGKAGNDGVGKELADGTAEELKVCKWCGGKYEPSAGCDCGGSLFESPKNRKMISEGGEDKSPILRWFDKVGAQLKRGKQAKESSVSPSDKKQKEEKMESVPGLSANYVSD